MERGSFCVPVGVDHSRGLLSMQSTEAEAGATHLSDGTRLAWKLALCTLTPDTELSLPNTPPIPWNLSWAGVQTAAPLASSGKEVVPGGELAQ